MLPDIASVNLNLAIDSAYDRSYTYAGGLENVADFGEGMSFWVPQGSTNQYGYGPFNAMPRSVRTLCDGDKFAWYQYSVAGLAGVSIRVDRIPIAATPYAPNAGGQFNTIVFKSAKRRLIELRTSAGIGLLATTKRYDLYKPSNRRGPRVLFIGNSYTGPYNPANVMDSYCWDIGPLIGSEDVWVDFFGGTGYGVHSTADGTTVPGTGANRFLDRVENTVLSGQTWDISAIAPKLVVVHGPENDKYKGRSNAQVIADATAVLTRIRQRCPKAKIVYVEGFTPPGFPPATYNPNFIAIRQGVQAACAAVGVYYIDIATTKPWINGAGTVASPNGDGLNSSIYISSDTFHPVREGHLFIRDGMARRLNKILADNGALLNQLVA